MSTVACFLYSLSKKLVFVPLASVMTAVHRYRLVLASNAQWSEVCEASCALGSGISADLSLWTDGRTHNYKNFN